MYSGVKIALDPTPAQIKKLELQAEAARISYNWALEYVASSYAEDPSFRVNFYAIRKTFNHIKSEIDFPWSECSSQATANGIRNCVRSYHNFFASLSGERKGQFSQYPKPKSEFKAKKSFHFTTGSYGPDSKNPYIVKIPRVGKIHAFQNVHKRLKDINSVVSMAVCKEGNRWFVCFCVEKDSFKRRKETKETIGVDIGVKSLAVTSNGGFFEGSKAHLKAEKKLKKLRQKLRKQEPGSNRWKETCRKIRKIESRIKNQRNDKIQKTTTYLVRNYETICLENLDIEGMKQDHYLAKAINTAGLGEFRRQMSYKAPQYGRELVFIDRFFPSSQLCSQCGAKNEKLTLHDRIFHCGSCGLIINRDLNAALNILHEGQKMKSAVAGGAPETKNGHRE